MSSLSWSRPSTSLSVCAALLAMSCGGASPRPTAAKTLDSETVLTTLQIHVREDIAMESLRQSPVVEFTIPFPKDTLSSLENIALRKEDGAWLSSRFEVLLPWHTMDDVDHGIRAARVLVRMPPNATRHQTWQLVKTREPTTAPLGVEIPSLDWTPVALKDFERPLAEPPTYATFPQSWLSQLNLRGPAAKIENHAIPWFLRAMLGWAKRAVNKSVAPNSTPIDLASNRAWLFDRSYTLLGVYVQTGRHEWLRESHRSVMAYLDWVADGFFVLAPHHPDLKYSYGQSLLAHHILSGNAEVLPIIETMADAGAPWDPLYTLKRSFFTERVQAYALSVALAAYEATGKPVYEKRVQQIVDLVFEGQGRPASSDWPSDTCSLHTMGAHEGNDDVRPICSPWMSAILGEVIWRYYWNSKDQRALRYFADLAQWLRDHGTREMEGQGLSPWYLASSATKFTEDERTDWDHSCEVAALIGRGVLAKRWLGEAVEGVQSTFFELATTCKRNLEYTQESTSDGKVAWRLSPARKFNWVFGTGGDLPWIYRKIKSQPNASE